LPAVPRGAELSKDEAFALFQARLSAAGARVERLASMEEAKAFLKEAEEGAKGVWKSPLVPPDLAPGLPEVPPEAAELGVSRALAGVAETGSVVLSSREGRRGQLLVPRHLVWLFEADLYGTLLEALRAVREEDAAALALHSGPSKSADIGQIMVQGVHGPGELWVGVVKNEGEGSVRKIKMVLKWDRVKDLEGKTLETIEGKPFRVLKVTDSAVEVAPSSSGKRYKVSRKHLEKAVRLLAAGEEIPGPTAYKEKVYDQRPAYAWAILHALGYV